MRKLKGADERCQSLEKELEEKNVALASRQPRPAVDFLLGGIFFESLFPFSEGLGVGTEEERLT